MGRRNRGRSNNGGNKGGNKGQVAPSKALASERAPSATEETKAKAGAVVSGGGGGGGGGGIEPTTEASSKKEEYYYKIASKTLEYMLGSTDIKTFNEYLEDIARSFVRTFLKDNSVSSAKEWEGLSKFMVYHHESFYNDTMNFFIATACSLDEISSSSEDPKYSGCYYKSYNWGTTDLLPAHHLYMLLLLYIEKELFLKLGDTVVDIADPSRYDLTRLIVQIKAGVTIKLCKYWKIHIYGNYGEGGAEAHSRWTLPTVAGALLLGKAISDKVITDSFALLKEHLPRQDPILFVSILLQRHNEESILRLLYIEDHAYCESTLEKFEHKYIGEIKTNTWLNKAYSELKSMMQFLLSVERVSGELICEPEAPATDQIFQLYNEWHKKKDSTDYNSITELIMPCMLYKGVGKILFDKIKGKDTTPRKQFMEMLMAARNHWLKKDVAHNNVLDYLKFITDNKIIDYKLAICCIVKLSALEEPLTVSNQDVNKAACGNLALARGVEEIKGSKEMKRCIGRWETEDLDESGIPHVISDTIGSIEFSNSFQFSIDD